MSETRHRSVVVAGLGIGQILAWGSSYYLLAVLAEPVTADTGWPTTLVVGGLSIGLVISGLVSPWVGSLIGRGHGRRLLALSAILLSAGLSLMAVAPALWVYLAAWLVMGLGMGMGLYSSSFGILGRLYRESARTSITALTLFGGLASTICWPLSTFLVAEIGWRGTCAVYAGLHLTVSLPIYLWVLSGRYAPAPQEQRGAAPAWSERSVQPRGLTLVLVTSIVMLGGLISAIMSVHVFTFLGAAGMGMAAALAVATLVGPSQVGARLIELVIARRHHPIWTMTASVVFVALGLGLLSAGLSFYALIMVLYGAGIGLASIARGTVPLALFGAEDYAWAMGKIALPAFLVQAAAPSLGAFLIDTVGVSSTLIVLAVAAAVNVALTVLLASASLSPRLEPG